MVNAPFLAKERGIEVREVQTRAEGDYHTLIRVSVKTDAGERSVAGTLFGNSEPRLVELFGIKVEAELDGHMMYIVNEDAPGFIGRIGTLLGESGDQHRHLQPRPPRSGRRSGAAAVGRQRGARRRAGGRQAISGVKRVMALRF